MDNAQSGDAGPHRPLAYLRLLRRKSRPHLTSYLWRAAFSVVATVLLVIAAWFQRTPMVVTATCVVVVVLIGLVVWRLANTRKWGRVEAALLFFCLVALSLGIAMAYNAPPVATTLINAANEERDRAIEDRNKAITAEGLSRSERDSWKAKFEEADKRRFAVEADRDGLQEQLDDREEKRARHAELVKWQIRIGSLRAKIKKDQPVPKAEYDQLYSEFLKYVRENLSDTDRSRLASAAGVNFGAIVVPFSDEKEKAEMWVALKLWEVRLGELIHESM